MTPRLDARRVALVTGGGSGIGLGVARALRAEGARVVVVDLDGAALRVVADELADGGLGVVGDVRSREAMAAAVDAAVTRFGGLDTLVLAAGVLRRGGIEDTTEEDWALTIEVNLTGAFRAIQLAAPHLRASGRGRIVAIGSDAARRGFAGGQAYTASKFGLVGLIESTAAELSAHGVTANTVCPIGIPSTGMGSAILAAQVDRQRWTPEQVLAARASGVPLGRNASVDDVVNAVLFFIAEDSGFLTGVSLDVDGGTHLGRDVLLPWRR